MASESKPKVADIKVSSCLLSRPTTIILISQPRTLANFKAFTKLLEQTVAAPRLSGSKVQTLTAQSQALTAQNLDTDLVTTFYRINAGLPPASIGRISSLYVFDAIARAARKDADREKEKGKAREGRGMTGLISKMEGVVDAWVGGMVDDGKGGVWVEGKVSWHSLDCESSTDGD